MTCKCSTHWVTNGSYLRSKCNQLTTFAPPSANSDFAGAAFQIGKARSNTISLLELDFSICPYFVSTCEMEFPQEHILSPTNKWDWPNKLGWANVCISKTLVWHAPYQSWMNRIFEPGQLCLGFGTHSVKPTNRFDLLAGLIGALPP